MPYCLLPKIQNVLQPIDNYYRKHSIAAKQMTNSDQFDTRFNLLLTAFERITQQIEQLGQRTDSNARAIEQTNQQIKQLGHRIDSNARAIEALTNTVHEFKRDRAQAYSLMADLAQNQSRMYGMMANLDERQEQLSQRQGEIVEIMKLLTKSN
ncbi:hypothetical protein [Moorena sp. SIO3A2]|uniref:hypothetical protein n=2 Tax=Moorena TaxID=1155738 RepID=UPI0013B847F4|nr:hypothetical protein [Moorena sp. SIO3A2]NEP36425.1 hypothetical protein [Moorena sp. SIO3B2]NEQ09565.1 hypothetical protein [Moorena sp. SIO4E2]NEQ13025.1 hypothetical protein [Moorena sp. SIO3E2]NES41053.1 hypothetical protein [Moorena sp. SIO2C4]NER90605.1 hypothetical protein [Moorena sp. SIO3A2]